MDFLEKNLSSEERLAEIIAFDRGLQVGLSHLFHHLSGYQALLEEELDEEPAALEYVKRTQAVLAKGSFWLDLLGKNLVAEQEYESLDIQLLLSGAVKRCQRVLSECKRLDSCVEEDEILVNGSMFQLQALIMKGILSVTSHLLGDTNHIRVSGAVRNLGDSFFKLMQSDCSGGPYYAVSVFAEGDCFAEDRQVPFVGQLLSGDHALGEGELELLQVYGILKQHGGEAVVQRRAAGTSGFTMLLPVEEKRRDMQAPHNIEDAGLRGTETVLLVDDEDMIWDVIIDMLQELGYSVILAANGVEAVEIYRDNPGLVDLVILDMVMPEMDGYQAFFELKKHDDDVKVLLSSGYVSEEDARDVLEAGAVGFLQKPYRMQELAKKIRSIFDR